MFELLGITEGPLHESLSSNIITLNGEQHARLRKLVHPYFTPEGRRPLPARDARVPRAAVRRVAGRGRCDFVTEFAKPYPALMIATVVGAPLEDAAGCTGSRTCSRASSTRSP